jgi:type VI protein secretion system component VasK
MRVSVFRALVAMSALYSGQALANSGLEDKIADVVVWVVVILVPIVGVTVFWVLHVWPERVAEQKHHPQASAIQALCLMSLVFGGLLWPLAMLWAYMKPMEFKLARDDDDPQGRPDGVLKRTPVVTANASETEVMSLRQQVATLQTRLDAIEIGRAPT